MAEKKLNIYEELKKVQQEIKANKGQFNSFGNYKYRSLEDIVEAFKKVETKGMLLLSDKVELIGDRYYITATATFKLGSEEISVSASAREPFSQKGMSEAQLTGATSSYARKYAVGGLLAIDDTKDADTMGAEKDDSTKTAGKTINEDEIAKKIAETTNIDELRKMYSYHKSRGDNAILKKITERSAEVKNSIENRIAGVSDPKTTVAMLKRQYETLAEDTTLTEEEKGKLRPVLEKRIEELENKDTQVVENLDEVDFNSNKKTVTIK